MDSHGRKSVKLRRMKNEICIYVEPCKPSAARALDGGSQHAREGGLARADRAGDGRRPGTNGDHAATGKSKPCVWRWQERYIEEGVDGPSARQDAAAGQEAASRRAQAEGAGQDGERDAAERDALERAHDGEGDGHQPHQRAAHLGRSRPEAASRRASSRSPTIRSSRRRSPMSSGLYMNPPDKALVLCVDEKSQIQALDRTQPGLPMKKGRAATMTHDYKRHGTTTLFAALDVKSGLVIGDCQPRHRAREFIRFLRRIDRTVRSTSICTSCSTTTGRTRRRGEGLARQASALQAPLHADQRILAQPRRALLRRDHDASASGAASSRASPTWRRRSTTISHHNASQTLRLDQDRRYHS